MPHLPVSDGHTIYYEVHGNPHGRPVIVLHGGPGGGLQRSVLRLFDLARWRIVLYDQRGCGRSRPRVPDPAALRANTTPHLVADIERLRRHLNVDRWTVFGGSWGSTLALAYGIKHPAAIAGLILRGVFLAEPWETAWLYEEGGVSRIYPREWARFRAGAGSSSRNLTRAYRRRLRLTSRNRRTRRAAARAWWDWEHKLSYIEKPRADHTRAEAVEELAVLENHYFSHGCWLRPGELLRGARRLTVPVTIVQGQLDLVCPAEAAIALHDAIPHSRLVLVPGAGHSAAEPSIAAALRAAIDKHSKI